MGLAYVPAGTNLLRLNKRKKEQGTEDLEVSREIRYKSCET
jgi:hypothetical protein